MKERGVWTKNISFCLPLRIHLETSSVLIRQLPVEFVKRPRNWKYAPLSMGEPLYFVFDCTYNLAIIPLQSNYILCILRVNTLYVFALLRRLWSW